MIIKKLNQRNQFIKFLLIGGSSVVLDYYIFVFLLFTVNTSLFMANNFAYIISLVINFFGHSFFTYQIKPTFQIVIKFIFISIINYWISLAIILFGITFLQSPEFWKFISICVVTINGFLIGRFWIFRNLDNCKENCNLN